MILKKLDLHQVETLRVEADLVLFQQKSHLSICPKKQRLDITESLFIVSIFTDDTPINLIAIVEGVRDLWLSDRSAVNVSEAVPSI